MCVGPGTCYHGRGHWQGLPGWLGLSPTTARSCELEVSFRSAKLPFPVFPSCGPLQQTLPQEITTPKPGSREKAVDPCAQPASFSGVSLDMIVSLLGAKLWESSFSALLPFFGGIVPTYRRGTGGSVVQPASQYEVGTGRNWPFFMQMDSDLCCSTSNAQLAMLPGEVLQGL